MGLKSIDVIMEKLPEKFSVPLTRCRGAYEDKATEIVLRTGRPLCIYEGKRLLYITQEGFLTDSPRADGLLTAGGKDIDNILMRLCDYSVYAFQQEINSGFLTTEGGVRVGLCGKAVSGDNGITNIRDIGTLSFRIAREALHCARPLLDKLDPLGGVLICGAPGSGKTTLIRDMARSLSYRYKVSLLDERGELSAFYRGKSGFDLGLCDIYAAYPKDAAITAAVRSMAPDIVACDELGERRDADMLLYAMRCGAEFIASVHASSMNDLRARAMTRELINTGAFRYIVFLDSDAAGRITKIYEMSDAGA